MSCPARTYPLKRPEGHQPPVPRWHLQCDDEVTHVCTTYIGVQLHERAHGQTDANKGVKDVVKTLRDLVSDKIEDGSIEEFETMDWNEEDIRHVFAVYWNDTKKQRLFLSQLNLFKIHDNLPEPVRPSVGLWLETFSVPTSRLETNYSGLDYLPGFARLPKTKTEEHTLTAYWGAARDRLGASAVDLFEGQDGPTFNVKDEGGRERHVVGKNSSNVVHIRTGQFWENCPEDEVHSYEHNLEPTLRSGLSYLRSTPSSGAMGLRYIRNTAPSPTTEPLKETCVTGFFTSLDALETWAKSHKSHLAIYNGAMRHAKKFGQERKFRTWHEVVVLKEGEGRFEYVNCEKGTGVMGK